jgi:hypothetical protein
MNPSSPQALAGAERLAGWKKLNGLPGRSKGLAHTRGPRILTKTPRARQCAAPGADAPLSLSRIQVRHSVADVYVSIWARCSRPEKST